MASSTSKRRHNLSRMNMRDLLDAFFRYSAIQAYLGLFVLSTALAIMWWEGFAPVFGAIIATLIVYPLVWYLLHRFVLHGRYLFKSPLTATMWKRIHFDHHQDPHNLEVLFGALYTTLPTIGIVTLSLGYMIGGKEGAATAFAAGLMMTCVYEFCHCVQHLNTSPKSALMKKIKRLHLAHHFHNEKGNFGITNFFWDRLFGTYYAETEQKEKSATVFNLGYDAAMAEKYPWVNALSEGTRGDDNPRRFRDPAAPKEPLRF